MSIRSSGSFGHRRPDFQAIGRRQSPGYGVSASCPCSNRARPGDSRPPLACLLVRVTLLALLAIAGCSGSGNYPVTGKIVDAQGQPIPGLEGSQVVFEPLEGQVSSVAEIAADGSFEAFTMKPGDGVPPGKYTVYIPRRMLDPERAAPQVIHGKYEKPETSGLEATVEQKKNLFEFKVDRAGARSS